MKLIRVKDLPQNPPYGVQLRCPLCGDSFSATAGDYFMAQLETVMRCQNDRTPLQLVRSLGEQFEAFR